MAHKLSTNGRVVHECAEVSLVYNCATASGSDVATTHESKMLTA